MMDKNRYKYLKKLNHKPSRYEAGSIRAKYDKKEKYKALVEEVIKEVKLNNNDSEELRYLMNQTENISDYYRRNTSNKKILIALGLIIKKKNNVNIKFKEHKAYSSYNLDETFLLTVSIKLSKHYQKYSPFNTLTTAPDHDILIRTGATDFTKQ